MMTDFGVYLVFERDCYVMLLLPGIHIHSHPSNRSRIIIIVVVCKIYVIFASFIHGYLEVLRQ
jgi:hypothetical protein